jgi:hypothetical protein
VCGLKRKTRLGTGLETAVMADGSKRIMIDSLPKRKGFMWLCLRCCNLKDECSCPARAMRERAAEIERQAWRDRRDEERELGEGGGR